jgi:hypothetical protein
LDGDVGIRQLKRFQTLGATQVEAVRRFLELAVANERVTDGRVARDAVEAPLVERDRQLNWERHG